jgi:hypothetical protein
MRDAVGRRVSYMRTATTMPDAAVRQLTIQIAPVRPTASAASPEMSASTAKPASRQRR